MAWNNEKKFEALCRATLLNEETNTNAYMLFLKRIDHLEKVFSKIVMKHDLKNCMPLTNSIELMHDDAFPPAVTEKSLKEKKIDLNCFRLVVGNIQNYK